MAPLPVITHVWRCALRWSTASGQLAVNVIHIRDESGTAVADDVYGALNSAVVPLMWYPASGGASVSEVDVLPLDGVHGTASYTTGSPAKWTGASGGTVWEPALSALIKLGTGLRGRTHRGRIFLPFTDQTSAVDGKLADLTVTDTTAAWQGFQTSLNAGSPAFTLGVASYKLAQFNVAESILCEAPLATQRRRQGRLRSS